MDSSLFRLLQLSDTALPIGGFSHSASLETYVQNGLVNDTASAKEFIVQMLSQNLHYTDAAFVSLAYDAAEANNMQALLQLDEECTAVKLPREMREASQKLGTRLMKIFQPLMDCALIDEYKHKVAKQSARGHYCITFGLYACMLCISKKNALTGFYYNAAAGMVTNSVKLVPLSQQHGQELLFSLQNLIGQLADKNMQPDKDLLGFCCSGFDIRSMQHERLYSRLYMS
jgi:urease accessory protein